MQLNITLDEPTIAALRELIAALRQAGVPADRMAEAIHGEALCGINTQFQIVRDEPQVQADILRYLASHAPERPEQPPLFIGYVITPYSQQHIASYDADVITSWLKRELPLALEHVKSEIGTGEAPERAAELLVPATTPDEVIDLVSEHYAVTGYSLNIGWTATQPAARLATAP